MKFQRLTVSERIRFQPGIQAIEAAVKYPLGTDFFQIDHGSDYFAFFDRLGEVHYYVALAETEGGTVAAVGAAVLRQVPFCQGEPPRPTWYLCDLKVHPSHQGKHLSWRLLRQGYLTHLGLAPQGYAISMNPTDGRPNPLVSLLQRFSPLAFSHTATLGIYALDAATMELAEPILQAHRGAISYLSLQGMKDLRLESTGRSLPLLHAQWGKMGDCTLPRPQAGYTHMFCAPEADPLALALANHQIYPTATASIISHGMVSCDWQFILTSDI